MEANIDIGNDYIRVCANIQDSFRIRKAFAVACNVSDSLDIPTMENKIRTQLTPGNVEDGFFPLFVPSTPGVTYADIYATNTVTVIGYITQYYDSGNLSILDLAQVDSSMNYTVYVITENSTGFANVMQI